MPECTHRLREELKAFVDGELAPRERAQVEKHLSGCASCQAELESLRQLTQTFATAFPEPAPLPSALRARILSQLPEPVAPRPFPFWKRRGTQALGGALAFAGAIWLWVRVDTSTLHERATASKAVASLAAPMERTEEQAKGMQVASPVVAKTGMPQPAAPPARPRTQPQPLPKGELVAKAIPSKNHAPLAPPPELTDTPPAETTPAPTLESRTNTGAPAPAVKLSTGNRGGFGGGLGGVAGGGVAVKAKSLVLSTVTLIVPMGKREETLTELRRRILALGEKEEPQGNEPKLMVTLPAEKMAAFRAELEKLGRVRPTPADKKADTTPRPERETLLLTVEEESGN